MSPDVQTVRMAQIPDQQLGECWAYRARQVDDLVPVEVLKIGTQRPARVLIQFLDDKFEGRQEWVPPARLKVRWDNVVAFRDREDRWERVWDIGVGLDDPGEDAARQVFDALVDRDLVHIGYREGGACRVGDPARLAEITGLSPETWTECHEAFQEDGELVLPWPITERIAAALAQQNPRPLLDAALEEEHRCRHRAIHGQVYPGRGGKAASTISPEICRDVDDKYVRPRIAIVRRWCGADAVDRYDELAELRKEIHRVGHVAEEAISALRQAGQGWKADHLARQLGTPVEMLRLRSE
jgi:hypothetical protein